MILAHSPSHLLPTDLFQDEKRSVKYLSEHSKEFMSEEDFEVGVAPDGLPIEANAAAASSANGTVGGTVPMEGVLAQ